MLLSSYCSLNVFGLLCIDVVGRSSLFARIDNEMKVFPRKYLSADRLDRHGYSHKYVTRVRLKDNRCLAIKLVNTSTMAADTIQYIFIFCVDQIQTQIHGGHTGEEKSDLICTLLELDALALCNEIMSCFRTDLVSVVRVPKEKVLMIQSSSCRNFPRSVPSNNGRRLAHHCLCPARVNSTK